jgi:hypothetical protein
MGIRQRRAYRWVLFFLSIYCFYYFIFRDQESLWAIVGFFVFGGFWYWFERRKMTELDALGRKSAGRGPAS